MSLNPNTIKWITQRTHENLLCIYYESIIQIAHLPEGGMITSKKGDSKDFARKGMSRMQTAKIVIPRSRKGAYSLTEYGLRLFKKAKPSPW